MELIEIGSNQIIFLLDREDISKYAIDTKESGKTLREGFANIVRDSGIGDQFLAGVLVQIFESQNGGCEMFVTKLPDNTDQKNDIHKKHVYMFDTIEPFLGTCKMLKDHNVAKANAYYDKSKKKYYLTLDEEHPYVSEFFGLPCKDDTLFYISEHCSLISNNAVADLSGLV